MRHGNRQNMVGADIELFSRVNRFEYEHRFFGRFVGEPGVDIAVQAVICKHF